jgi:hypothetical protein
VDGTELVIELYKHSFGCLDLRVLIFRQAVHFLIRTFNLQICLIVRAMVTKK